MPNRILKESICTSETLEPLKPDEEILFYRLIVQCDDYGRLDARPAIVRAKCFPLRMDRIKNEQVEKWLQSLAAQKLIQIYIVDEKPYLEMITWKNHQQTRAAKSKYPDPSLSNGNHLLTSAINCNQLQSDSLVIENVIESVSDKRKTISDNRGSTATSLLPDGVNKETWESFLEVRKKKKAVNSPNAINLIFKELEKLRATGDDPQEVVEKSIRNSWKDVFALGGNGNGTNRGYSQKAANIGANSGYPQDPPGDRTSKIKASLALRGIETD